MHSYTSKEDMTMGFFHFYSSQFKSGQFLCGSAAGPQVIPNLRRQISNGTPGLTQLSHVISFQLLREATTLKTEAKMKEILKEVLQILGFKTYNVVNQFRTAGSDIP